VECAIHTPCSSSTKAALKQTPIATPCERAGLCSEAGASSGGGTQACSSRLTIYAIKPSEPARAMRRAMVIGGSATGPIINALGPVWAAGTPKPDQTKAGSRCSTSHPSLRQQIHRLGLVAYEMKLQTRSKDKQNIF